MKTWIFAGICDKSELLLYVCRLLAAGDNKVLLVDATEKRKYPYYIGQLDKPLSVTEFAGFDVACGFNNEQELKAQFEEAGSSFESYNYVIYDMEIAEFCPHDVWETASALVWVSDYEIWTLEKGSMWLEELIANRLSGSVPLEFYKVFVRAVDEWFDDSYTDSYFDKLPVNWKESPVIIPWNELDLALKLNNEHTKRIQMKALTRLFKKNLCLLIRLLTDFDQKTISRALRSAERRKA